MAASSQQLQAEVVVQVLGRGSLLGQDARPPGVPGPAPWLRCIPSRELQHSVAPTSLLCCGQAVLFQAGLGVLLHVCLLGSTDALQGSQQWHLRANTDCSAGLEYEASLVAPDSLNLGSSIR